MDITTDLTCPECLEKLNHVINAKAVSISFDQKVIAKGMVIHGNVYLCPICKAVIARNDEELKKLESIENE